MDQQSQQHVQLKLSADEALVLFEFASRFTDSDQLTIADQSEAQVLWNLCGRLEKQLAEPLSLRYAELLAQARARLRGDGSFNVTNSCRHDIPRATQLTVLSAKRGTIQDGDYSVTDTEAPT